jgi:hypothetical protein
MMSGAGYRAVATDVHDAVIDNTPDVVPGRRKHGRQRDAERCKSSGDHATPGQDPPAAAFN